MMPANQYHFTETWTFPDASPDEIYGVLSDALLLPKWWKGVYLSAEQIDSQTPPRVGSKFRVKARGFLPYKLNFILEPTELQPGKVVETLAHGDFEGRWRATLSSQNGGAKVDIDWTVTVVKPLIRFLSPVLKPVFAWNHYWTTPRGESGMKAYLAETRGRSGG